MLEVIYRYTGRKNNVLTRFANRLGTIGPWWKFTDEGARLTVVVTPNLQQGPDNGICPER